MTMSKLTQPTERKRIVVKLGGSMLGNLSDEFFQNFLQLREVGYDLIIVHGGGPAINRELAAARVTSTVLNGIRVTSEKAISIIQSTLIGQVNPDLVHHLNRQGIEAIGLSGFDGGLLTCSLLDEHVYGFVGEIKSVRSELILKLLHAAIVPVISCIGATSEGAPLNINADTVASHIALALQADSLLLVTDTPGIRVDGSIQTIASSEDISRWIDCEAIYGGMLPKVEAALACLNAGVPSVQIVGQQLNGTVIAQKGVVV